MLLTVSFSFINYAVGVFLRDHRNSLKNPYFYIIRDELYLTNQTSENFCGFRIILCQNLFAELF